MDIKGVVKEYGLTLVQVAQELGITKGGLSQSIHGNPTIETLRSIAKIVGCKVGDFFRDEMTETRITHEELRCPYCGKQIEIKIAPLKQK